jgi:hypothetical protein
LFAFWARNEGVGRAPHARAFDCPDARLDGLAHRSDARTQRAGCRGLDPQTCHPEQGRKRIRDNHRHPSKIPISFRYAEALAALSCRIAREPNTMPDSWVARRNFPLEMHGRSEGRRVGGTQTFDAPMSTEAPRLTKLFIHHRYANVESGPAEPAGTFGPKRLFRLKFIPFAYATPTYDDIVVASKDPELAGNWTFECPGSDGMDAYELYEHGGRYAMVVDYVPGGDQRGPWLPGLPDIICAVASKATNDGPGRIHLAVPDGVSPDAVMILLRSCHSDLRFDRIRIRGNR